MSANENLTVQARQKPYTLRHGGYWLWRVLRSGAPNRRSAVGRRFEARRLAYAIAQGYPAWFTCPAPLQAAIDNVIRQEFLAAALFSGFWTGGPEGVPRAYHTVAENLRRQLSDLGLEPRTPTLDVAAALAAMRGRESPGRPG
jgi:hypothetical protein